jgi:hypothetical protein
MAFTVTIFKNIKSTEAPFFKDVSVAIDRIKTGNSKELIENIRGAEDKSVRQELKKGLASICFSGTFNKRNDNSLVEHSGLICLDFDGYEKNEDMLIQKEAMTSDEHVYSVFVSPSGNGLKVLVKIPVTDADNHKKYFNGLKKHFNSEYFDVSCVNVSRVCYESYDPLIFVNEDSLLWNTKEEPAYVEKAVRTDAPSIPISDESKVVDILIKWWLKEHPMSGGRNNSSFKLAAAFNDYGINKSLASHVLNQYAEKDFTSAEIKRTVDSAYEQVQNFGTKYFEDEDRVNQIKTKLKQGASKKDVKSTLSDVNLSDDDMNTVIDKIEEDSFQMNFWDKNDKGVVDINPILFKQHLEDNGFYKYSPESAEGFVFVKVINNMVVRTDPDEIKDFIMGYLKQLDDSSIFNFFAKNVRFFRNEFLTLLDTINVYMVEDEKHCSYLYYRNCAVKITPDNVEEIEYIDLEGYVWKNRIINRDFKKLDKWECDYKTFISRISADENERTETMESTIGFLMHGYKNLSYCPAVILNDEVISENPEGGTGKGLFMNAISRVKRVGLENGKSFSFEGSFRYQKLDIDTQVISFDDVKKNFDFEKLFSVITEGITLEKKFKDAMKIPFDKSPKVAITTNYAIKGAGNSFARRKWEVELHPFFNGNHTPYDEFKRDLFTEWDDEEWCRFDNYMINCLKNFLRTGLVKSKFVNLKIRQLSAETSHEFIEWCGLLDENNKNIDLVEGLRLMKSPLYSDFINEYPDYAPKAKMTITMQAFNRWLHSYAVFKTGMKPLEGRVQEGRWIQIVSKPIVDPQKTLDI